MYMYISWQKLRNKSIGKSPKRAVLLIITMTIMATIIVCVTV